MASTRENGLGRIEISESVIAIIAGTAASECYGLVGMASRNVQDGISEFLGWENLERGVQVYLHEGAVEIELHIVVEYGVKISEVAHNVMEQVKYAVENSCGLEVLKVNVHVEGVRVRRENKRKR
ncbi:MAG: Asp23/Gls24 family envelope stress response protein [Firmicutes bacterium]|nr:Asp23/Gls24 family envelope stress response protein [Bacillota bacterium]